MKSASSIPPAKSPIQKPSLAATILPSSKLNTISLNPNFNGSSNKYFKGLFAKLYVCISDSALFILVTNLSLLPKKYFPCFLSYVSSYVGVVGCDCCSSDSASESASESCALELLPTF